MNPNAPPARCRVAFRLSYLGEGLSGSQFQPYGETVEGYLWRALAEAGLCVDGRPPGFEIAGRTDAGVSALGQVFAADLPAFSRSLPRRLNAHLPPQVGAWACSPAPPGFSPRRDALRRTYAYALHAPGWDALEVRRALKALEGEHDFRHLCRRERGRGTAARIERAELGGAGPLWWVRFTAPWFLWQQVRRMAGALDRVGRGERPAGWVADLLRPGYDGPAVAPLQAEGLFLEDVEYLGLAWEMDRYALEKLLGMVQGRVARAAVRAAVLGEMAGRLQEQVAQLAEVHLGRRVQ